MRGSPDVWTMHALEWSKRPKVVYPLALGLRIIFIIFGEWQDRQLAIQYTDIDYEVISDAAELAINGGSPYDRATFRYSPLMAYLLIPNVLLHRCWGKVLFSVADLVVGKSLESILSRQGLPAPQALQYASLWMLNPLSINVSTRGSFDAVTIALVLGATSALLADSVVWAAIAFGIVVHMRLYPIIYAPAFALHLAQRSLRRAQESAGTQGDGKALLVWRYLLTSRPLLFALLFALTFVLCTAGCVSAYGKEFVHNALLYHATRTDNRHNYSIYWYWIYLDYGASHRWVLGLAAFLPQAVMLMASAILLHRNLALCMFVQTSFFVFFNKVFTGQYITWYLSLGPLLVPHMAVGRQEAAMLGASWIFALVLWLFVAWNLEMQGRNVFLPLWIASVSFFTANVTVLNACVRAYRR